MSHNDCSINVVDVINRMASSFPTNSLDVITFKDTKQIRTIPGSQLVYFVLLLFVGYFTKDCGHLL